MKSAEEKRLSAVGELNDPVERCGENPKLLYCRPMPRAMRRDLLRLCGQIFGRKKHGNV